MVCCGQKRAGLSTPQTPARPNAALSGSVARPGGGDARAAAARSGADAKVTIRYTKTASIVVRGVASGRRYAFSGQGAAQAVDQRDVAVMLRSGWFRR